MPESKVIKVPIELWAGAKRLMGYVIEVDAYAAADSYGIKLDVEKDVNGHLNNSDSDILEQFHKYYYERPIPVVSDDKRYYMGHLLSFYKGYRIIKTPMDLWISQEIIWETKPDLLIETGTAEGGADLWYAELMSAWGGKVVSIDNRPSNDRPKHGAITYILGDSVAMDVISRVETFVKDAHRIMVILDSDHSCNHVLKELEIYSNFVTKECYLIVEDTNVNGHPVFQAHGPGPFEAVHKFLENNGDFEIDKAMESRFLFSLCPDGYLKRL